MRRGGNVDPQPILIAGLPRSGTSWIAKVIATAPGARYIREPDYPATVPWVYEAWRDLPKDRLLSAGESVPSFELLWGPVFLGGRLSGPRGRALRGALSALPGPLRRPATRGLLGAMSARIAPGTQLVVKTVHSSLTLEWLAARYAPTVVRVERNPLNVVGSWIEFDMGTFDDMHAGVRQRFAARGLWPPPPPGDAGNPMWTICAMTVLGREAAARHPGWLTVRHEELCVEPVAGFRRLFDALGLGWTEATERALAESNRPGRGYDTQRVAADEVDRWRRRLSPRQLAEAVAVMDAFGLGGELPDGAREPAGRSGVDA